MVKYSKIMLMKQYYIIICRSSFIGDLQKTFPELKIDFTVPERLPYRGDQFN